jgi:hypothetical protein
MKFVLEPIIRMMKDDVQSVTHAHPMNGMFKGLDPGIPDGSRQMQFSGVRLDKISAI